MVGSVWCNHFVVVAVAVTNSYDAPNDGSLLGHCCRVNEFDSWPSSKASDNDRIRHGEIVPASSQICART